MTALIEARDERSFLRLKAQFAKLDLLVLDELGYVPASKVGSELLFDVISTAYERTSLIVTTNLPFESWTEVLGSERLTGATLDRLTHRCRIIETKGESYRLQDAKARTNRAAKSVTETVDATPTSKLTSDNRSAAVFDHYALPFSIMIHNSGSPIVDGATAARRCHNRWATIAAPTTRTRISTAAQMGKPPPGERSPPDPEPALGAADRPVAGSGAPTQGGFFWAGGALGTAGKLSVAVADAVRLTMVEFPVPVKPVYSSPTCCPVLMVSVPPVVVAGTVKKYTASKSPSSSLAALVEEKTELFERPSTGDPPLGVKVSSVPAIGLKLEKKWPEFGWP